MTRAVSKEAALFLCLFTCSAKRVTPAVGSAVGKGSLNLSGIGRL